MIVRSFLAMSAIITIVIVCTFSCAGNQPSNQCLTGGQEDEVKALIKEYVALNKNFEWEAAAGLISTPDIEDMKSIFVAAFEQSGSDEIPAQVIPMLGGEVRTLSDLRALPAGKFYALFLKLVISNNPGFEAVMRSTGSDYVGTVCESDSVAYSVTKMSMQVAGETVHGSEVVPLRKSANGEWKIGLKMDLKAAAKGMADALSR